MGRGRKKNASYKRRTNVQIEEDNRKKGAQQRKNKERWHGFSAQPNHPDGTSAQPNHPDGTSHTDGMVAAASVTSHAFLTTSGDVPDNYLQGIPQIFWSKVRVVISEVRKDIKAGKSWSAISQKFPDGLEYHWTDPVLKANPEAVDFLLRPFCRLKFFSPDRQMAHHLNDGKMPCPWHGTASTCVIRNTIFNPNGPRMIYDGDGSRIFLFSGRYLCKINRDLNSATKNSSPEDETKEDTENHSFYFLAHDPRLMQYYSHSVRTALGAIITRKKAVSFSLYRDVLSTKESFRAIEDRLREKTSTLFFTHQLSWLSSLVKGNILDDITGHTTNADFPTFDDIKASAFISRR